MAVVWITPLYAGLSGLLLILLSFTVTRQRRNKNIGLGDAGDPQLARAIRVHANFVEYAPLALILLLFVELANYPTLVCHSLGLALFLGRCFHASGLSVSAGYSLGRFIGTILTWSMIAAASGLCLYAAITSGLASYMA